MRQEQTQKADPRHEDEAIVPVPAVPLPRELAGSVGNQALARALAGGAALPRGTVDPRVASMLARAPAAAGTLQRGPDPAATAPAATNYEVGPNSYREDQWNVAIGEVANLWTMVGGVLSQRKEAVAEFCGTGGAGAEKEPSLTDQLIEAAITAVIAAATDGIGTVVAAGLGKAVTGVARRLPIDPEAVLTNGTKVVDFAVKKGKEKANEKLGAAMKALPTPDPSGGTPLGKPLERYHSALNETLDADGVGSRAGTLQQLLAQPDAPEGEKWALAAAMYDALHAALTECKHAQWNATSDGWFQMQIQSGAGELRGFDTGIVVIDLSNGAYPSDRVKASGAYLGGKGANDTTVAAYNGRKLEDIDLPIRIRMDSGNLGFGILDCGFQLWKPIGASGPADAAPITRWGLPWLAAKALGLRDIDTDDPRVDGANIARGATMLWDELKSQSAQQLGASFSVMGMTSGVGASPF